MFGHPGHPMNGLTDENETFTFLFNFLIKNVLQKKIVSISTFENFISNNENFNIVVISLPSMAMLKTRVGAFTLKAKHTAQHITCFITITLTFTKGIQC